MSMDLVFVLKWVNSKTLGRIVKISLPCSGEQYVSLRLDFCNRLSKLCSTNVSVVNDKTP